MDLIDELAKFLDGRLVGYSDREFFWVDHDEKTYFTEEETKKLLELIWV